MIAVMIVGLAAIAVVGAVGIWAVSRPTLEIEFRKEPK